MLLFPLHFALSGAAKLGIAAAKIMMVNLPNASFKDARNGSDCVLHSVKPRERPDYSFGQWNIFLRAGMKLSSGGLTRYWLVIRFIGQVFFGRLGGHWRGGGQAAKYVRAGETQDQAAVVSLCTTLTVLPMCVDNNGHFPR
jgi:hypothetical protein